MHKKKDLTGRIGLIDEVRGFAILCMVVYHAVYDMIVFLDVDIPFFFHPAMNVIRDLFVVLFVFISGAACRFSRSNLKRGLLCFGLGLGMTAVTGAIVPDQVIMFGILHCLGIGMMLYPLARQLLDRIPAALGIPLLLLLFLATYRLAEGYLGILPLAIELPVAWYRTNWLFWLGLPSNSFFSADYFPLLPWLFAFFLGSYLGRWLKDGNPPDWIKRTHLRPLAFVGRNTIWVYLFHQPVLMGIFWLLAMIL